MGLPQWAIGSVICLAGALAINLGMNVQKLSHMRNDAKNIEDQTLYVKQPLWWLGFSVFMTGELLNFASLGFASQTLLSVLGSFSLVCNTVFAPCLLKEHLSTSDLIATVIIICGGGLVVGYSDHAEQDYSLAELEELYKHPGVIIFLSACLVMLLACWALSRRSGSEGTQLIPVLYATAGSIMGAAGFLLAKSFAQLLKDTFKGHDQFRSVPAYGIMAGFIVAGVLRIHWVNKALQTGHALLVVPIYFVLSTVLTIVGGLLYFQEYTVFDVKSGCLFGVGVLLTLLGVFIIARNEATSLEDPEECDLEAGSKRDILAGLSSAYPLDSKVDSDGSSSAASGGTSPEPRADTGSDEEDTGGDTFFAASLPPTSPFGSPFMGIASPAGVVPPPIQTSALPPPPPPLLVRSVSDVLTHDRDMPSGSRSVASTRSGRGRRYSYKPTAFTASFLTPQRVDMMNTQQPLLPRRGTRTPNRHQRRVSRRFSVGVIGLGLS